MRQSFVYINASRLIYKDSTVIELGMKFKMSLFSQVLQRRLVLRCCLLASYVPLPDAGSANVPALNRLILNFINNTIEPYFAYS